LSLISSIIGSDQTSKAVNSLVGATNTAMATGNTATAADQTGVTNAGASAAAGATAAGASANNTLGSVLNVQGQVYNPYTTLGTTSANTLNAALSPGGSLTSQFSFDPNSIASNPDYQFQLQQGLQAVKQAAAATGTLGSSQTLKGLTNYAGGLASSEIGQAYNQALSTYQTNYGNTLSSLGLGTQTGLNASNSLSSALQNYGNTSGANSIQTSEYGGAAGLQAATTAGQFGQQNATAQEQLALQQGAAKAGGSLAQGNIWGGFSDAAAALAGLG